MLHFFFLFKGELAILDIIKIFFCISFLPLFIERLCIHLVTKYKWFRWRFIVIFIILVISIKSSYRIFIRQLLSNISGILDNTNSRVKIICFILLQHHIDKTIYRNF